MVQCKSLIGESFNELSTICQNFALQNLIIENYRQFQAIRQNLTYQTLR